MQQNYARVSGVVEIVALADLVEDAIKIHGVPMRAMGSRWSGTSSNCLQCWWTSTGPADPGESHPQFQVCLRRDQPA